MILPTEQPLIRYPPYCVRVIMYIQLVREKCDFRFTDIRNRKSDQNCVEHGHLMLIRG